MFTKINKKFVLIYGHIYKYLLWANVRQKTYGDSRSSINWQKKKLDKLA